MSRNPTPAEQVVIAIRPTLRRTIGDATPAQYDQADAIAQAVHDAVQNLIATHLTANEVNAIAGSLTVTRDGLLAKVEIKDTDDGPALQLSGLNCSLEGDGPGFYLMVPDNPTEVA
jgi:hypothetical protein